MGAPWRSRDQRWTGCRHPEQFAALIAYLGAIAQYLLPGVTYFDGVPLNQVLVANSTASYGMLEEHALYGAGPYYGVSDPTLLPDYLVPNKLGGMTLCHFYPSWGRCSMQLRAWHAAG